MLERQQLRRIARDPARLLRTADLEGQLESAAPVQGAGQLRFGRPASAPEIRELFIEDWRHARRVEDGECHVANVEVFRVPRHASSEPATRVSPPLFLRVAAGCVQVRIISESGLAALVQ